MPLTNLPDRAENENSVGRPRQRRVPTHRAQTTDTERDMLFAALIQLPSLFMRARLALKDEHFAPHERWLKTVWALTVNFYDQYDELPSIPYLIQCCNSAMELDPDAVPEGDEEKLATLLDLARDFHPEDMPERAVLMILQKFLEDRLLHNAKVTFASPQTPLSLREAFSTIADQAAGLTNLLTGDSVGLLEDESLGDFMADDTPIEFLVDDLVPAGVPGVAAGRMKSLKSTVGLDLYLSVGSGTSHLGCFNVPQAARVGIISCESGRPVIRESVRRIAKGKGMTDARLQELYDSGMLSISTKRPNLLSAEWVTAIEEYVVRRELRLLIIDPAYLTLAGSEQNTLSEMAKAFGPIADICERTGCTILFIHHNRKNDRPGKPTLESIVGSGFGEFARFWILLARRREWDEATGRHWLHYVAGSPSYGGHYHWLDVREARCRDPGGRVWDVQVLPPGASTEEGLSLHDDNRPQHRRAMLAQISAANGRGLFPSGNQVISQLGGRREDTQAAIRESLAAGVLERSGSGLRVVGSSRDEDENEGEDEP